MAEPWKEPDSDRRGMRIAGGMATNLLVTGEYEIVEAMTQGKFMSASQLRAMARSLDGPLAETPSSEWAKIELLPLDGQPPGRKFVAPLWTSLGPSGVGLEMRIVPTSYGTHELELLSVVDRRPS
jgi:hypothetical protein